MIFSGRFVWLVLFGIVMLSPLAVMAQDFTFTKIVDTDTPIPGGVGNFTDFGRPVMRGGKTVFWGEGAGQGGIFLHEGDTLTKLVDIETVFPDVPGTLTGFESVSFDGETVAFFGMGGSVSPRPLAILTSNLEGTLSNVASPQTIDGVHWTFSSPLSNRSLVSVDSGRTAYIMRAFERSVFVSMNDGVVAQVINSSTTLDDAGNPFRNSPAHYFLPSADEWDKAACYNPDAEIWFDDPPLDIFCDGAARDPLFFRRAGGPMLLSATADRWCRLDSRPAMSTAWYATLSNMDHRSSEANWPKLRIFPEHSTGLPI